MPCHYCGSELPRRKLTRDHIVPRGRNGPDRPWNVVLACEPCNQGKGVSMPSQEHLAACERCTEAVRRWESGEREESRAGTRSRLAARDEPVPDPDRPDLAPLSPAMRALLTSWNWSRSQ